MKDDLQRHVHERRLATTRKLLAAIERMQAGQSLHVPAAGEWTLARVAKEAQVNINTLSGKNAAGEYDFAAIRDRVAALRNPPQSPLQAAHEALAKERLALEKAYLRIAELSEENDRLKSMMER